MRRTGRDTMQHALHPLTAYWSKRDFRRTPEPRGRLSHRLGQPRFVVQLHEAHHRHWDLRLEIGGVLKSWSLPVGPSVDPRERRVAIPAEDHPVQYARFQGTIPPGLHGAGQMLLWDEGTWELLVDGSPSDGHARGRLDVRLTGRKLRGAFALFRPRPSDRSPWLLVKLEDEEADAEMDVVVLRPQAVRRASRKSKK
ncbi:MAG TPA: DNA polymerase ligase N-terminal domain-containing protein [Candidatus Polarisedimenticolaceae bacterium]|nr:DNA polymerase ligase N-terminal domain-containing protein [Candidatus Polarisedimenticolaceae bacterium]